MLTECVNFIHLMHVHFRVRQNIFGIACNIFHLVAKTFAFTEFDRYMVASISFFIASKIEYYPIKYFDIIQFYYDNKKGGPKGKKKPFDDVKDKLKEDFIDQEMKIMKLMRYDFEFELPFKYLEYFRDHYLV
jgi:hypothetical protein